MGVHDSTNNDAMQLVVFVTHLKIWKELAFHHHEWQRPVSPCHWLNNQQLCFHESYSSDSIECSSCETLGQVHHSQHRCSYARFYIQVLLCCACIWPVSALLTPAFRNAALTYLDAQLCMPLWTLTCDWLTGDYVNERWNSWRNSHFGITIHCMTILCAFGCVWLKISWKVTKYEWQDEVSYMGHK